MEALKQGADTLFLLLGAVMVLAMHAGFAFLELGTVRRKNQVNALVKILVDFCVSTIAYFFIGYTVAYGTGFFVGAEQLVAKNGYELVKFFFLLTFAAAIPAIISGGIAERARFWPQLIATAVVVGVDKARVSVDLSVKPRYLRMTEDWWLTKRIQSPHGQAARVPPHMPIRGVILCCRSAIHRQAATSYASF